MAKILFFQPHPDDLELNCGHIMNYLSKSPKNHEIKIIAATKGEFGLPGPQYDKYKGRVLSRIRVRELFCALQIQGIPKENVTFFGYIDGYLPFNKDIINKVQAYLEKEKPDTIFCPEPLYTWYVHNDHVNLGRAVYYVIHNHLVSFTPKVFFYSSICSNFYFPFSKSDLKLSDRLISCHKTQYWLLKSMRRTYFLSSILFGFRCKGWNMAEAFRQVFFEKKNITNRASRNEIREKNKPSLMARIWHYWFWKHKKWYDAKYPLTDVEF